MPDKQFKRRRSPRVQAEFAVEYTSLSSLVTAYTENISKGGIYLRSDELLPVNTMVNINFILPEGGPQIKCVGQVARVCKQSDTPHIPTGMAILFRDLAAADLELIEEFIAELTVKENEDSVPPVPQKKLNVLVVDDDKTIRNHAARTLTNHGHDVQTAEDGMKALVTCLNNPPDLVLTDVQMPRMDGWTLVKTIRARPSLASTLIVFQTSLGSEKDRLHGYQLGVDDYIAKPYTSKELMDHVDKLIARTENQSRDVSHKALRGDLEQVSLPTVLSLLALEKKTGVVLVAGPQVCRIFVHNGRPLSIEMDTGGEDVGQMTMAMELFSWTTGQFEFAQQDVPQVDRIKMSMHELMMEAARLEDESNM